MEIYLDNAATTRAYDSVGDIVRKVMCEDYGNPSSLHMKGVSAEGYIKKAREILAKTMKVEEKELLFTSGGTESNNLAIIGGALANQRAGKHLITTVIEHPAVHNPMIYLEKEGFEVTYLPVNHQGIVEPETLKKALRPDTILVSIMCVNNEIGAIQPLEPLGRLIKENNPDTLFHVDAIQGYGKMVLHPKKLNIDLMSVSGHKIHGPKGVGLLYIKNKTKVRPQMLGGGQQRDMRSGTENVPGIAGLGQAAREIFEDFQEKSDRLYQLRQSFIDQVSALPGVVVNGPIERGDLSLGGAAPHVVSVSFADIRAEVLLHALEEQGIYVSSGSACASNHPAVSGTLKAIGVQKQYLDATLRFSFSYDTTQDELDRCIAQLNTLLPVLRRYTPGGRRIN